MGGASTRKKREKKKDFQVWTICIIFAIGILLTILQKAKLKVGKTKAKADNFTDTSFKSRCTCHDP